MDLLKQLQAEGRLDSRGKFTLDLAARQQKLVVLQRKEPWLFLFKLAQAALLAGADRLTIEADPSGVAVEFVPTRLPEDEDFPAALLAADKLHTPWLRQLALGVILAFAAEGRGHRLLYDDGRTRSWLEAKGLRQSGLSALGAMVRLSIESFPRNWWKSWFRPAALDRLKTDLQRRLSLYPLEVVLNGSPLAPLVGEQIPGHGVRSPWLFEWLYPAPGGFAWAARGGRSQRHNAVHYARAGETRNYETRWWVAQEPQRWEGHSPAPFAALAEQLQQQGALLLAFYSRESFWEALLLPEARQFATRRPHPEGRPSELAASSACIGLVAAVQLPYVPQGMARIVPVSHGLCLEEIDFPPGPPGGVIYLQRDDWEVDIGQLQTLPHQAARQQALQLWAGQLKQLESFIYLQKECERMGLPMATRDGWRQYLRKRK